jgi:lipoprotein NlpI
MAFRIFGTGTKFIGKHDERPNEGFIATEWFVIIWVPVLPLRSRRVTAVVEERLMVIWLLLENDYATGVIGSEPLQCNLPRGYAAAYLQNATYLAAIGVFVLGYWDLLESEQVGFSLLWMLGWVAGLLVVGWRMFRRNDAPVSSLVGTAQEHAPRASPRLLTAAKVSVIWGALVFFGARKGDAILDAKNLEAMQGLVQAGAAAYASGKFDEAKSLQTRVIEDAERTIGGRGRLRPQWERLRSGAYYDRSVTNIGKGDFAAAVRDADVVLAQDGANADAFNARGFARYRVGEWELAATDFDHALALRPQFQRALVNRGINGVARGKPREAAEDFDRALALNPKDAYALRGRMNARWDEGNVSEALSDAEALLAAGKTAAAYTNRAHLRVAGGEFALAAADYDEAVKLGAGAAATNLFQRYLLARRLNEEDAANDFRRAVRKWKPKWETSIGCFLADQLTERELLTAATDANPLVQKQRLCQTFFYVGMVKLLAGEHTEAALSFERCLATENRTLFEYRIARAELARIAADRVKTLGAW